jgi:microcystin-dependent protein
MPYNINYTDPTKPSITVFDNLENTDTSLNFPGRNVTGYGRIIGENFLHLLENFASNTEPESPVEGQIWYNSNPAVSSLLVFDGVSWKAASGVQRSPNEPPTEQAKVGELWVDTINQQLQLFNGSDWIVVGPEFSSGLLTGLKSEQIIDSNDIPRVVSKIFVENVPIIIISKDSFTPKEIIPQFPTIRAGITIATPDPARSEQADLYFGGLLPKLYGTAASADGLNISNRIIEASKFLRSDVINVVENSFNVKSDAGITFGVDGTFNISTSVTSTRLYNNSAGSSIDFQLNNSGLASTVVRIVDGKVGINTLSPTEPLDVTGNVKVSGILRVTNSTPSTNANNGAVQIAGGVVISENLRIGKEVTVNGNIESTDIIPQNNDTYRLGSSIRRWDEVWTKTLSADNIVGNITGGITGNAASASKLQNLTEFRITGDLSSTGFRFDGQFNETGESPNVKVFNTTISPTFITTKQDVSSLISPNRAFSLKDDFVLVYRQSVSGLLRATRDTFVGDLGLPIGAILPFAGPNLPFGFLLCDGSELLISQYFDLYQIIGDTYNGSAPLQGNNTFRLPDLRGRFALGRDNMDNGFQVAAGALNIDAGGGNADRVGGVEPDTLGGSGGNSEYTLAVANLPDHVHDMEGSTGQKYFAVRSDTSVPLDSGAFLGFGGTTANRMQYLPNSGGIDSTATDQPYAVMNPFLTINYIIRAGAPAF